MGTNALAANKDDFLGVGLVGESKRADLPIESLPLKSIELTLQDGRSIAISKGLTGLSISIEDVNGETLASLEVPDQKPEAAAHAAHLRAVATRLAERVQGALADADKELREIDETEATSLPPIALPGPQQIN